eukprot:COSAG02_NODE_2999_length_7580_cov_2.111482_12_plen_178_part_01
MDYCTTASYRCGYNDGHVVYVQAPLFLYYAPHLVHDPLQVEPIYLERMTKAGGGAFDNETETNPKFVQRWTCTSRSATHALDLRLTPHRITCNADHAMVKALDDQVGNLTAAVKEKQMWKDTLLWCVEILSYFCPRVVSQNGCVRFGFASTLQVRERQWWTNIWRAKQLHELCMQIDQ